MRQAIAQRDLTLLGTMIEADTISMHVVCMTQTPPSIYWDSGTLAVMHAIRAWRDEGLESYFTMDAGANVHVICAASDQHDVQQRLERLSAVQFTLVNRPGPGARLIPETS